MKKNVGTIDAILRFLLGIILISTGLFYLDGIQGNIAGIFIALCSIFPFTFSLTRKCPVFHVLDISSIRKKTEK